MAETTGVKITDIELNEIKRIQSEYGSKTLALGDLRVQRILLQQQWNALDSREKQIVDEFTTLQQQEQECVAKLTEAYGPGSIDMSSGMFMKSSK